LACAFNFVIEQVKLTKNNEGNEGIHTG